MDYALTFEQQALQKLVRDFAEGEIRPVAPTLWAKEAFSIPLTEKMGKLGLMGILAPQEYGGLGLDPLSYILVVEELARVSASQAATVAAHNTLGVGPIARWGSPQQKKKYLPDLCAGTKLWGFGLTEPDSGSDAGNARTTAALHGGRWVINGAKIFITNAATTMTAGSTVECCTGTLPNGKKEISCLLVEQGTKGFTARPMHGKMVWRASNTAELFFDNVAVPEDHLLGKRGEGFRQMLETLDAGRLGIAAMALGGAQGAFEEGLRYAKSRKAFGTAIAGFQANAFKLADCATQIAAARALLYRACWLKATGQPFAAEAAMAKLFCSQVFKLVADHAVQLHGGYGCMEEYPVATFYRDAKFLEIGEGTSEIQRLVIARHIGCFESSSA
ncbi:MAG: acyl-CoA dehydrogenase family protein [Deltaproteobacteria bacterium]|nr:acyl-CoA dehydrogenase family protein [Deltaproteobacteria bacterium]